MEVGGEMVAMEAKTSDLIVQMTLIVDITITINKVRAAMVEDKVVGLHAICASRPGT